MVRSLNVLDDDRVEATVLPYLKKNYSSDEDYKLHFTKEHAESLRLAGLPVRVKHSERGPLHVGTVEGTHLPGGSVDAMLRLERSRSVMTRPVARRVATGKLPDVSLQHGFSASRDASGKYGKTASLLEVSIVTAGGRPGSTINQFYPSLQTLEGLDNNDLTACAKKFGYAHDLSAFVLPTQRKEYIEEFAQLAKKRYDARQSAFDRTPATLVVSMSKDLAPNGSDAAQKQTENNADTSSSANAQQSDRSSADAMDTSSSGTRQEQQQQQQQQQHQREQTTSHKRVPLSEQDFNDAKRLRQELLNAEKERQEMATQWKAQQEELTKYKEAEQKKKQQREEEAKKLVNEMMQSWQELAADELSPEEFTQQKKLFEEIINNDIESAPAKIKPMYQTYVAASKSKMELLKLKEEQNALKEEQAQQNEYAAYNNLVNQRLFETPSAGVASASRSMFGASSSMSNKASSSQNGRVGFSWEDIESKSNAGKKRAAEQAELPNNTSFRGGKASDVVDYSAEDWPAQLFRTYYEKTGTFPTEHVLRRGLQERETGQAVMDAEGKSHAKTELVPRFSDEQARKHVIHAGNFAPEFAAKVMESCARYRQTSTYRPAAMLTE